MPTSDTKRKQVVNAKPVVVEKPNTGTAIASTPTARHHAPILQAKLVEHRHHHTVKPTCNKYLAMKCDEAEQRRHAERLQMVKAYVDCKPPRVMAGKAAGGVSTSAEASRRTRIEEGIPRGIEAFHCL